MLGFALTRKEGLEVTNVVSVNTKIYEGDYLAFSDFGERDFVYLVLRVTPPSKHEVDARYFRILLKHAPAFYKNLPVHVVTDYDRPISFLDSRKVPMAELVINVKKPGSKTALADFIESNLKRDNFYFLLATNFAGRARDLDYHEEQYTPCESHALFDRVCNPDVYESIFRVYVMGLGNDTRF